jgi:membrane protease YdiL (CAAX protease family)
MEESIRLSTIRQTIHEQIAHHPLAAFVFLAYMISWISWSLIQFLDTGSVNGFSIIGANGPTLSATIISAILRPESSGIPQAKRWRMFGITWIGYLALLAFRRFWITTGLTTLEGRVATDMAYPHLWAFLLDALASAVVAFVLSGAFSRWQGVHDLMRSLDIRTQYVRWYWIAFAAVIYPAIVVVGNMISTRLGLSGPAPRATGDWYWLALDVVITYLAVLLGGGGLEEPGWRGFALPQLQKRYNPFLSSLILAPIWAFWHWPMFWYGYYGGGPFGVFFYTLGIIPISILLTAAFNRTRGNLPVAILIHTSVNTTPFFMSTSTIASGIWLLLMLVVAFRMWRSPQVFASSKG